MLKWSTRNRREYEDKGYKFTNYKKEFEVSLADLTEGSSEKIKYICDYCLSVNQKRYSHYLNNKRKESLITKDACDKCRWIKIKEINLLKKGTLAEKYPELINEWDFHKNKIDPNNVAPFSNLKAHWKCKKCDKGYLASIASRTFRKTQCPYCTNRKAYDGNSFESKYPDVAKEWSPRNKISPSEVTYGSERKVWWICQEGHEWLAPVNSRKVAGRCPRCNASKGEQRVREVLESIGVKFFEQYRFVDCKDRNPLSFDFIAIRDDVRTAIEYDGRRHFHIIPDYNEEDQLLDIQNKDSIKDEYCKKNNIHMIRIPYWEFDNIEKIIRKEFKKKTPQ